MTRKKPIEWTDATWNPVRGCKPVSPGCVNCYAEPMTGRLEAMGSAGYVGLTRPGSGKKRFLFTGEFRTAPDRLKEPLYWKRPRMVFVNSMSDLFGEGVPFEFIAAVFGVMAACPQHAFQILTKRAERMLEFFKWVKAGAGDTGRARWFCRQALLPFGVPLAPPLHESTLRWPLPNVWLGTSCENQEAADQRIPHLLRVPAPVRFLSCEPLLGPIKLTRIEVAPALYADALRTQDRDLPINPVNWVITGGESGPNARPCQLEWIADIVAQCKAAGVPSFVKQLGSNAWDGGKRIKLSGKGGDPTEWPAACKEWPREWPRKVV